MFTDAKRELQRHFNFNCERVG